MYMVNAAGINPIPIPFLNLRHGRIRCRYRGVLSQKVDGEEHPIAFFLRVMNSLQKQYCTTQRELLAVISALQHFHHYLLVTRLSSERTITASSG